MCVLRGEMLHCCVFLNSFITSGCCPEAVFPVCSFVQELLRSAMKAREKMSTLAFMVTSYSVFRPTVFLKFRVFLFLCSGCLWVWFGLHVMWSPSLSLFFFPTTHTHTVSVVWIALQTRFLSSESLRHTQTLPNSTAATNPLLPHHHCFIFQFLPPW